MPLNPPYFGCPYTETDCMDWACFENLNRHHHGNCFANVDQYKRTNLTQKMGIRKEYRMLSEQERANFHNVHFSIKYNL